MIKNQEAEAFFLPKKTRKEDNGYSAHLKIWIYDCIIRLFITNKNHGKQKKISNIFFNKLVNYFLFAFKSIRPSSSRIIVLAFLPSVVEKPESYTFFTKKTEPDLTHCPVQ